MEGFLYLEDGTFFKGKGFGKTGTKVGELVFNTSMTGYQGILTDPSYTGQVINLTYPLIGNSGIIAGNGEAEKVHALGLIARHVSQAPSHYQSICTLDEWLKDMGVPGVCNLDTRAITRKIRNHGTAKCVISNEGITLAEAKELCMKTELKTDQMKTAGTREIRHYPGGDLKVAVLDFGVKGNIVGDLVQRGCTVTLFPYGVKAEEILAMEPDGIFLSNGPGDPQAAVEAIGEVATLMSSGIPMFGICLGHQILALAAGGNTYKLKYGHRGGNHAVYDKDTGRSYITAQNHGYAVQGESILLKGLEITHINLNDGTVEGMKHIRLPIFSVQFYPEASPLTGDSAYLFDRFTALMKGGLHNA